MAVTLTDAEIAEICRPLKQPAAQIRYLLSIGIPVRRRPDGTPLVLRSDVEGSDKGKSDHGLRGPVWPTGK
jgi:hypothetical protein